MIRSSVFILLFLSALSLSVLCQNENTAPIALQRYKVPDRQISIEFPKLPVVIARPIGCSELERTSYLAYAAEAVYELTIAAKPKLAPAGCRVNKKFSEALVVERLAEIRTKGDLDEASGFEDGRQVYRFSRKTETRWLYSDMKNSRWIELAVVHREDTNTNEQRFFNSLKFDDSRGDDIGAGAETTLGDEGVELLPAPATVKDANRDRIQIVVRPLAMYTEKARKAKTQGNVTLRITFLANGSIGNIEVVKGLANGLTENAVAAAKKMVFLPSRSDGKPVNTQLTVQYGFSIY